jgi:hypothetical protein
MVYSLVEYKRVERYILVRQNGACRFCKDKLMYTETVVSVGHTNKRYYHRPCAEKLHII